MSPHSSAGLLRRIPHEAITKAIEIYITDEGKVSTHSASTSELSGTEKSRLTFARAALTFGCRLQLMNTFSISVVPSLRLHQFLFTFRFSFGRGGAVEAYRPKLF